MHDGAPLAEAAGAVVLLHGRGATAKGILGLGREIGRPDLAWLAPQAAGGAWYPQSFLAPLEAKRAPALVGRRGGDAGRRWGRGRWHPARARRARRVQPGGVPRVRSRGPPRRPLGRARGALGRAHRNGSAPRPPPRSSTRSGGRSRTRRSTTTARSTASRRSSGARTSTHTSRSPVSGERPRCSARSAPTSTSASTPASATPSTQTRSTPPGRSSRGRCRPRRNRRPARAADVPRSAGGAVGGRPGWGGRILSNLLPRYLLRVILNGCGGSRPGLPARRGRF